MVVTISTFKIDAKTHPMHFNTSPTCFEGAFSSPRKESTTHIQSILRSFAYNLEAMPLYSFFSLEEFARLQDDLARERAENQAAWTAMATFIEVAMPSQQHNPEPELINAPLPPEMARSGPAAYGANPIPVKSNFAKFREVRVWC